jgi:CheY-like chemotaxis protein
MPCILVLDDQPDIVTLLKTLLERWGFEVVAGRNGEEGLNLLSSVHPAAIISNIRMPHMDGMDFLDRVRVSPEWSSIPIVMMSALCAEECSATVMQHGANAFLAKPFRIADVDNLFRRLDITVN